MERREHGVVDGHDPGRVPASVSGRERADGAVDVEYDEHACVCHSTIHFRRSSCAYRSTWL